MFLSIGKTLTHSDIKENCDPRVEFVDMLAAGAGTAGMRNIETVRWNRNLRIDIEVFHVTIHRPVNLECDAVSFAMYCFDDLSRVSEFFTHRRNMHIDDSFVGALIHRPQFDPQLLARKNIAPRFEQR